MDDSDWETGFARAVGVYLNGDAIAARDQRGQPVTDESFLVLFNAHDEPIDWHLPGQWARHWRPVLVTADHPAGPSEAASFSDNLEVPAGSLVVPVGLQPTEAG